MATVSCEIFNLTWSLRTENVAKTVAICTGNPQSLWIAIFHSFSPKILCWLAIQPFSSLSYFRTYGIYFYFKFPSLFTENSTIYETYTKNSRKDPEEELKIVQKTFHNTNEMLIEFRLNFQCWQILFSLISYDCAVESWQGFRKLVNS